MKLTNSELIQESEKEFIDTINAELDWNAIEQMILEKHGFSVQDDVVYKDGNLIVHKNEIAYKFDFEIKVPLSVIFNRDGECLEISTQKGADHSNVNENRGDIDQPSTKVKDNGSQRKSEDMVSEIIDMISEINN